MKEKIHVHELAGNVHELAGNGEGSGRVRSPSAFVQDQERLLEQVERDTDGVMSRVSASMHKMHDVIKKMNSCTQMGIIAALIAVLIVLIFFLGN